MRFQRLTNYLLTHHWQAMILVFLITYIPFLGMASILVAGLFTLCAGALEGAFFTLAASLPYALVFFSKETIPTLVWATVLLSISGNILTWVFAVMLTRHCSWSWIVQVAALFGVLVISIIHLAYPGVSDWWSLQLQSFYNQSTELAALAKPAQLPVLGEAQMNTINIIKKYATGIVTAFVLFTALVQAALAQWWQIRMVKHTHMGKELLFIRLSHLAGMLFILSIVFYYLENSVVLDILPVLCLLFGAAGLSLVHYLCNLAGPVRGRLWLSVLYAAMMCSLIMMAMLPLFSTMGMVFPVVLGVLALLTCIFVFVALGLFDVWFDVRKRIQKI